MRKKEKVEDEGQVEDKMKEKRRGKVESKGGVGSVEVHVPFSTSKSSEDSPSARQASQESREVCVCERERGGGGVSGGLFLCF